jgi:hypothetical protein
MTRRTKSTQPEIETAKPTNAPAALVQANTKVTTLIAMLGAGEGATLDQMVAATRWQPHTTRAALTRLKARGYAVTSVKADGIRTYRASGPVAS